LVAALDKLVEDLGVRFGDFNVTHRQLQRANSFELQVRRKKKKKKAERKNGIECRAADHRSCPPFPFSLLPVSLSPCLPFSLSPSFLPSFFCVFFFFLLSG
jgi:hypothetical protein